MYPIAFSIGSIDIYWYGILMACTFVAAYFIARYFARLHEVDVELIENLFFISALAGLVGSRLGAVIPYWRYFLQNPLEIFSRAGMASHGAIIAIMVLGYFYVRKHRLNYWQIADFAAPILPVGHIFIRLGNFMSGELYGPPTNLPWAIEFPGSLGPVHPSQLYEVLASIIILPLAWKWAKNPRYPGYAFLHTLLLHSIVRFFLDFIRQHSELYGPFVLSQIIALGICILTVPAILILNRRHKLK
ncbi:MAG: prolipoprotein diacylglyceryl transferase [Limnochordia bacterium]|jgi:phosphatidylglycerol:prolipoprotein diacylglycerol transferase|nr:prolipoprotein diacylglyceryl transferase [Limnochordia bacterium]